MRKTLPTVLLLLLAAGLIQGLAATAIALVRGSATAYAYQSPDAEEYVAYARGLASRAQFVRVGHDGQQLAMWPDTWRTPGYPAVLAMWVRVLGDGTAGLLVFHQVLTALTVPLLWLILRRHCSPRWALAGALAWCLDPFRIYYSLWLLAETFFTLVLLVGVYAWSSFSQRGWTLGRAATIGLIGGGLVLIRPIALPLPVLACVGLLFARRSSAAGTAISGARLQTDAGVAPAGPPISSQTASIVSPSRPPRGAAATGCVRRLALVLVCGVGTCVVVAPWSLRNRLESGHWGLTSQAGASLAYHKVADVMLWAQGQPEDRFNAAALAEVRQEVDRRLLVKWEQTFGPASQGQRRELHWRSLNFGQTLLIDPFAASKLLQKVGVEILLERKAETLICFATQGLSMLVFPLGLAIAPPAGTGPLSLLGGGSPLARIAAIGLGLLYAALLAAVLLRLVSACIRYWKPDAQSSLSTQHSRPGEACWRSRAVPSTLFALWPALALFALSVPSEDPRFRLPLIPLFLLMLLGSPRAGSQARG